MNSHFSEMSEFEDSTGRQCRPDPKSVKELDLDTTLDLTCEAIHKGRQISGLNDLLQTIHTNYHHSEDLSDEFSTPKESQCAPPRNEIEKSENEKKMQEKKAKQKNMKEKMDTEKKPSTFGTSENEKKQSTKDDSQNRVVATTDEDRAMPLPLSLGKTPKPLDTLSTASTPRSSSTTSSRPELVRITTGGSHRCGR